MAVISGKDMLFLCVQSGHFVFIHNEYFVALSGKSDFLTIINI